MSTLHNTENERITNTTKPAGSIRAFAKRVSQSLLGFGVLFAFSAVAFCPVTQAALTTHVLPFISALIVSLELNADLFFLGLLAIGLGMRSKYQH